MKKIWTFVFSFLVSATSFAQVGEWTWIHGSNAPNSTGNYGTQGVASSTNEPPANYEPAEWTDKSGNFWFYGGLSPGGESYNDLWKYNPTTNEWTWMNGTMALFGDPGVFGTQGVASLANRPPSLGYAAATWVDQNGNLWLFAGYNTGNNWYYSDLWEYNIGTNEWTWMNGPGTYDPAGVYGTQGVSDAANYPRCRTECASNWTDNSGNLWLFGAGNGAAGYNDLWRYNIATNEWTWMKGVSTSNAPGVYGTQGVEAAINTPGGRWSHSRWSDKNGNFYLFGGAVGAANNFNDLWRYNPTSDNWAWMSGKSTPNDSGFYGTKCVTTTSNLPWSRFENRTAWTDPNGNFWMFGGAFSYNPTSIYYTFNDLWMYCTVSNEWTWVSGDSIPNSSGNWGTLGVTNATNKPNGRNGAAGWTDNKGNLYFFGGAGAPYSNHYNDLWEYVIDPNCGSSCSLALPVPLFQASDSTICTYDCISFTDHSSNATSWQWIFTGGSPSSSTEQNPQSICYLTTGIFNVKLIASNSSGSDSLTINNYISVIAAPATPSIEDHPGIGNDTLFFTTQAGYSSYQWLLDSTLIPNATDTFLIVFKSGNYNVQVTGTNGCKIAAGINVTVGLQNYMSDHVISLSPNPATSKLLVNGYSLLGKAMLRIYNVLGEVIQQSEIANPKSEIDISLLPSGIYFIQLIGEKERWVGRFVKE